MKKVIIIAEGGVNHNGSIILAKKLVNLAIKAKADFIKFQAFKTGSIVISNAPKARYQKLKTDKKEKQYDLLKKLELDENKLKILINYCYQKKIKFLFSVFDKQSLDFLVKNKVKYIKIPSGEITNLELVEAIGKLNKIVFLSTGMSNLKEVRDALNVLIKNGTKKSNIYILHCNSEYPTPFKDVNLLAMKTIEEKLKIKTGYSDHTIGKEVSIAAIAMGAQVIEKHITLNKKQKGPDHVASMDPNEFVDFVRSIKKIETSFGNKIKKPSNSEIKNIKIVRKSVYASQFIQKGEKFTSLNLCVKRPNIGINPMKIKKLYGKISNKDYKKDELIKYKFK